MKRGIQLIGILIFSVLISCSEDDQYKDCMSMKMVPVKEINAPETAVVNQPVEIEVTCTFYSSCGSFSKFVVSGPEKSRTVLVEAKYEGCICAALIKEETKTYEFIPTETGTYTLEFQNTSDTFITINIEVTNAS